jgi:hypothetical protein
MLSSSIRAVSCFRETKQSKALRTFFATIGEFAWGELVEIISRCDDKAREKGGPAGDNSGRSVV